MWKEYSLQNKSYQFLSYTMQVLNKLSKIIFQKVVCINRVQISLFVTSIRFFANKNLEIFSCVRQAMFRKSLPCWIPFCFYIPINQDILPIRVVKFSCCTGS
eukprot:NODE_191_length_15469_cov_0.243071.p11 type:complete len:102 gc:universal NODE_191_length_15469_cov_0.243071:6612-6307(-)